MPAAARVPVPVLSAEAALERLAANAARGKARVHALYASPLGGIVKDPALMMLPLTDHMVHRGHGVFDTATLACGGLYRLRVHVERLLRSAEIAKIPHSFDAKGICERVCAAAAASGQRAAAVRFWLTAGSGDFHWLPEHPSEGVGVGAFYCAVFSADGMEMPDASRGIHEFTVSDAVPWKPPLLASTKSNNYMLNCMMGMVSRERGGWFGIGVDASGNIGESCVGNVAAVVEGEGGACLVTPPFEGILAGTTVRRVLEMVAAGEGGLAEVLPGAAEQRALSAAEAKERATEIMIIGGDTHVMPCVAWDGTPVGDGAVGPVARALEAALVRDRDTNLGERVEVPYGQYE